MIVVLFCIVCLTLATGREYYRQDDTRVVPIPYQQYDNSLKTDQMYHYYSPKFNSRAITTYPFFETPYTYGYKPYRYAYGVRPVLKDYMNRFRSWKLVIKSLEESPRPKLLS